MANWPFIHKLIIIICLFARQETETANDHRQEGRTWTKSIRGYLTALLRTLVLYSSPMVLSWPASSSMASLLGNLWCSEALSGCSLLGSRSGRGPCWLDASWCSSLSDSAAEKVKSIHNIRHKLHPEIFLPFLLFNFLLFHFFTLWLTWEQMFKYEETDFYWVHTASSYA